MTKGLAWGREACAKTQASACEKVVSPCAPTDSLRAGRDTDGFGQFPAMPQMDCLLFLSKTHKS